MTKENVRFGINIFVLLKYSVFYDVTAVRIGKNLLPFRMQHSPSGKKNQYYQQTERNSPKDLDFQGTEKVKCKKKGQRMGRKKFRDKQNLLLPCADLLTKTIQ